MSTPVHLDVFFQIVSYGESGDASDSWVEGAVPAFLLDPSEHSRPEMARSLLYELKSRKRQNVDLSGVDYVSAEIEGDPGEIESDFPETILIDRVDGEWTTEGWVPVPGYEPSELPSGEPSPGTSPGEEDDD
jgi:hypothetical protein